MGLAANGNDGSRTPFATPEYLMRAYLGVLQEGEVRGAWLLSLLSPAEDRLCLAPGRDAHRAHHFDEPEASADPG
jgi:hypothetical protein